MSQQIALVTGASSGIGKAIAVRLGAAGAHVIVAYNENKDGAQAACEIITESGGSAEAQHADLTIESSVGELFMRIAEKHDHLDILVHDAVKEVSKPLNEATFAEWRTVMGAKLDGAFLVVKAALPLFERAHAPSVVMISTYEALQPSPDYPAYGVANAGLESFVKAMALFLPKYGARCNAVCPGPVRTPLWGPDYDNEALWEGLATANPVGRNATPEDVSEVVHLLLAEPTRMINGSFVYVNGGNHLRQP